MRSVFCLLLSLWIMYPAIAQKAKSNAVIPPKIVGECQPDYPKSSLRNEETGIVRVAYKVASDGRFIASKVLVGNFKNLEQSAKEKIQTCIFQAGKLNGRDADLWNWIDFSFSLDQVKDVDKEAFSAALVRLGNAAVILPNSLKLQDWIASAPRIFAPSTNAVDDGINLDKTNDGLVKKSFATATIPVISSSPNILLKETTASVAGKISRPTLAPLPVKGSGGQLVSSTTATALSTIGDGNSLKREWDLGPLKRTSIYLGASFYENTKHVNPTSFRHSFGDSFEEARQNKSERTSAGGDISKDIVIECKDIGWLALITVFDGPFSGRDGYPADGWAISCGADSEDTAIVAAWSEARRILGRKVKAYTIFTGFSARVDIAESVKLSDNTLFNGGHCYSAMNEDKISSNRLPPDDPQLLPNFLRNLTSTDEQGCGWNLNARKDGFVPRLLTAAPNSSKFPELRIVKRFGSQCVKMSVREHKIWNDIGTETILQLENKCGVDQLINAYVGTGQAPRSAIWSTEGFSTIRRNLWPEKLPYPLKLDFVPITQLQSGFVVPSGRTVTTQYIQTSHPETISYSLGNCDWLKNGKMQAAFHDTNLKRGFVCSSIP